jgi:hypothetical protein
VSTKIARHDASAALQKHRVRQRASVSRPPRMLREDPTGHYRFPFREEFSNWRDEQTAWAKTRGIRATVHTALPLKKH